MDSFHYHDGRLHCEDLDAHAIAERVGTPCYVYSRATLLDHYGLPPAEGMVGRTIFAD